MRLPRSDQGGDGALLRLPERKEKPVRKGLIVAGVSALLLLAVQSGMAKAPAPAKNGTIVIVFRDGHRQTFSLSDIERVEFPSGAVTAGETGSIGSGSTQGEPPRGRFVGKWEVGDGMGNNFYITLNADGSAYRTLGEVHGRWEFVNGGAQISWNDGAMDAIRKVGSRFEKSAYAMGKKFTDEPDNVTAARNTSPRPI